MVSLLESGPLRFRARARCDWQGDLIGSASFAGNEFVLYLDFPDGKCLPTPSLFLFVKIYQRHPGNENGSRGSFDKARLKSLADTKPCPLKKKSVASSCQTRPSVSSW